VIFKEIKEGNQGEKAIIELLFTKQEDDGEKQLMT
jgi:hypothetical protein